MLEGSLKLNVVYKNRNLQKVCTNTDAASKKYGIRMAQVIRTRIGQIKIAKNTEEMLYLRLGRCHALKGDRAGQYAMDLVHPYRLIFEQIGDVIQIARIVEITDYH